MLICDNRAEIAGACEESPVVNVRSVDLRWLFLDLFREVLLFYFEPYVFQFCCYPKMAILSEF